MKKRAEPLPGLTPKQTARLIKLRKKYAHDPVMTALTASLHRLADSIEDILNGDRDVSA